MAACNYHKGNNHAVVQQLNELFGDKLNLDIIKTVAKSCQFDVHQSSNELIEIASSVYPPCNPSPTNKPTNRPVQITNNKSRKSLEIERTIRQINDGFKVLIILRGLPGSGKSTLAKTILQNTIGYDNEIARKHVLSTDDFFLKNDVYDFKPEQLSEAHGWNHQRAFNVMSKGYSPVIIDNTNTQMWEMKPYAMMATDYGYILEVLEPDTHWCFNDKELTKRNIHGVAKSSIQNMLERYQKNVTPMKLLTAYDCKYKLQKPPQYRLHPPLSQAVSHPQSFKENTNFMEFRDSISVKKPAVQGFSIDDILMNTEASFLKTPVLKPVHTTKMKQSTSLFDSINAWGVDETALRSWDLVTPLKEVEPSAPIVIDSDDDEVVVETREISTSTDGEDFSIVRNIATAPPPSGVKVLDTCSRDINRYIVPKPKGIPKKLLIDKSCITEDYLDDDKVHLENLSRVFPNITQSCLKYWYQKCNRDFDCTIELLLAEKDEVINIVTDDSDSEVSDNEQASSDSSGTSSSCEAPVTSPKTLKNKRKNNNSSSDESHQDLKKCMESKFTISASHYSEKLLKVKQLKFGPIPVPQEDMDIDDNKLCMIDDIDSDDKPNDDTIELNLGEHLVKQLEDHFGDPNLVYPKGFQPVVQMPASLARQLYTFYIESVYQQMDAQNSIMDALTKEDEEFARKLQESEDATQPDPTEIPDIMREQRHLGRMQKEADKWKEESPDTLAARLTLGKLFNTFPTVDRTTLMEILHAHDNVYKDTVESLLASNVQNVNGNIESIKDPPLSAGIMEEMWEAHESCKTLTKSQDTACSASTYREEANKYLEKRKLLYEKAQRSYQSGLKEVAQFYSQLAQKQTRLYEQANSLAATAFLDEHSKRLENFNTLDLHFLYIKEAIPHLDIFLDRNINLLRMSPTKSSECLQIITGRGKNSKHGVAKIRPAVIGRLKSRNISFQQLNPGLLKVKVTKLSKVTSEL